MDEELSLAIIKKRTIKSILKNIFKTIIILLFPIVLFFAIELLNGMDMEALKASKTLLNLSGGSAKVFLNSIKSCIRILYMYYVGKKWVNILLISALLLGVYSLIGRLRKSMVITTIITMALAIVNYLLIEIRGTAITPSDFYSIVMATKLVNNVSITISSLIFISIGLVVLWIFLCSKLKFKQIGKKKKIILRVISGVCFIVTFIIFFSTDLLNASRSYNTKNFYKRNGVCASFLTILKEMSFEEPEGYSIEAIEQQLGKNETKNVTQVNNKNTKKPNVIAIMNESLSDLKEIYGLKITEDNMPFIHSLKENTIKANVHTTAIGSKTANCEWEFLTGNSTRFLPTEAVAYEQYIKKETYSLVNLMNSQGYYTSAYHPYNPEGYNRMLIYPLMGFKEYKFRNELSELNEIRYDFADDLSTYKNIINLFENKKDNEKIFNFTVTMQNHTAYKDTNFENTIFLEGYDKKEYSEINQYLSSVKLSDEAFKYLVEYFKKFDEPTIIMMYGDHQPGFVENYPEIFGETSEEEYDENKYITPMVLWANYDIKEYEIQDISMNYLSIILFNEAGLEKSEYMKYLEDMYNRYPVINSNVYKDSQGTFVSNEQDQKDFELYEYIQYNNMFDDEKLNYLFE